MSPVIERCLTFTCAGEALVGVLHVPTHGEAGVGIVLVVGGPQYRVGSHRQFVLMAREIAAAGFPVLRFDYRGMGDSEGMPRSFESVDEDIRAAVDALCRECPNVSRIVGYGLCDAASALLGYCTSDGRIAGLVLVNPWARTEQGEAKAYVRHYYPRRLLQRSLWAKLVSGEFRVTTSLRSALGMLRAALERPTGAATATRSYFLDRMLQGLQRIPVPVLIQISELDLTAREFLALADSGPEWRRAMRRANITIEQFEGADHTFSAQQALGRATRGVIDWLSAARMPRSA